MKDALVSRLLVLVFLLFAGAAARAATVNATFTSATSVPVTAPSYTATGNTVNFTLSYAPTVGTTLTVVKNTGLSFISGTFGNLAQGQEVALTFNSRTYRFVANYYGGTGNDLVLAWADTRLVCWGNGSFGQLGDGEFGQSSAPKRFDTSGTVLAGKTFLAFATGAYHTVVLCSDGTVATWGDNTEGQLGDGTNTSSGVPVLVTTTGVLAGKRVVAIAAGDMHTLALCSDGTVAAWGSNQNFELGNSSGLSSNTPVAITISAAIFGKAIVGISAGKNHNLVLCSDGTLAAWGRNADGQLGDDTTLNRFSARAVTVTGTALAGKTPVAIAAGGRHSLALCSDGTLTAWGFNAFGELGDNSGVGSPTAVTVTKTGTPLSGKTITAITAGGDHSMALCSDGTLAVWGYNNEGELGTVDPNNSLLPVAIAITGTPLAGKIITVCAAGGFHSAALTSDGLLAAWGDNSAGQVGDDTYENQFLPVAVLSSSLATGEKFIALATSAASSTNFALVASPVVVTGVTPGTGIRTGNTSLTLSGRGFTGATGVTIGGVAATNVVVVNDTTITCKTPANVSGPASVVVTTPLGSNASNSLFTYFGPAPTVSNATPNNGSNLGGTMVTLTGTNFIGTTAVTFGGSAATDVVVASDTSLTCTTPAHGAGGVSVIVTTLGGSNIANTLFSYNQPAPSVSLVSPDTGSMAGGTSVTITGTGFTGATGVTIGGVAATSVAVVNATTITCTTPAHAAGAASVVVTTPSGSNGANSLFTFVTPPPTVSGITPNAGTIAGGTSVTITGSTFTGATGVTLGGVAATNVVVVNATTITCSTPPGSAGTASVVVTTPAGSNGANTLFNYFGPPPRIDQLTPAAGVTTGGQTITLTGANFIGTTGVSIGGNAATSVNVLSSTAISCITPAGSAGAADVVVTTLGGSNSTGPGFTYLPAALTCNFASAADVPVTVAGFNASAHSVTLSLGFAPLPGTTLMVVKNTSQSFISGTFSNLAQGEQVALSYGGVTYKFVANYFGGTGNDLVLQWAKTRAMAWGWNSNGQLGNNSYVNSNIPVNVDTSGWLNGVKVIAIAAGGQHCLVLGASNELLSWGAGSSGELGNNGNTLSNLPVRVTKNGTPLGARRVVAIAAGGAFNLALCSDGTLASWGNNFSGQLGNNSTTTSLVPVAVTTAGTVLAGKTVVAITAGLGHSVVRCSDGTLAAWGNNFYGTTGDGGFEDRLLPVAVTTAGTPLAGRTVIAVAAGSLHTLALCSDGTLVSWGRNGDGQLGNGDTSYTDRRVPTAVTTAGTVLEGKTVIAIAAGGNHSLALCSDGTLAAWGYNNEGQLGNDTVTKTVLPIAISTAGTALEGKTVTGIAAGSNYSVAYCADGTMASWGTNLRGEAGSGGNASSYAAPVTVNTSALGVKERFVAASVSSSHTLAMVASALPEITSVLPDAGPVAGGTNVTITGSGFNAASSVTIGGTAALNVTVVNDTTITCTTPAHAVAVASVLVTTDVGENAANTLFTYYDQPPTVASVTPNSGGVAGGTSVTITGTNFIGTRSVSFGGRAATNVNVLDAATLTCTTPTGNAGTASVVVTTPAGSSAANTLFTYVIPAPGVTNVTPATGVVGGGTRVTITGSGFLNATSVTIGGTAVTNLLVQDDATITCDTPAGSAGAASVVVTTAGGSNGANALFSYYYPVPVVSSLTPDLGSTAGGMSVTVAGTGFTGATGVSIGGNAATSVSVLSDTSLACITPAGSAGTASVVVTTPGGSNAANALFTYQSPVMDVRGNALSIASGSGPSVANGTDFGAVTVFGAQVTHFFSIASTGAAPLELTGSSLVSITGPTAAEFRVTQLPAALVAGGDSTEFAITFDPIAPGLRSATLTVANTSGNQPAFTMALSGSCSLPAKRSQAITFTMPATAFLTEGSMTLTARSSSGLPVALALTGPATLALDVLTFTGTGTVKVIATQAGDSLYLAAPTITRTITVKASPTALTLTGLSQVYDGTPKPIGTLGGTGTPVISYKVGAVYVPDAPVNAGSYAVKAVAGTTTVTGTLVIAKAPLLVMADDKRRLIGQANPALTMSYSGFRHGETSSVFLTAPTLSTTASLSSVGGVYPITVKGGSAANYTFLYSPGSLVVDTFAGSYEALLMDGSSVPVGKLSVTVGSAATNKFTGKLYTGTETAALSLTGSLVIDVLNERASATVTSTATDKTPYVTTFTLKLSPAEPMTVSVTRNGSPLGTATDGRKLSTATVLYAGTHTAVLEPATPAGAGVPLGAGWATATISSTGVLTLAGRLGDDTAFTATLSPDTLNDPGYRIFVQPYLAARKQSWLAGQFTLLPHPSLTNRRYVPQTGLSWKKTGLPADASYRAGFGPVSTVLMLDPWLPPVTATKTAPAITLAQRLGLNGSNFYINHTSTGSASQGNLPVFAGISPTSTFSVISPAANLTKWKIISFASSTGAFTGSFELLDGTAPKRTPTFSGVLRQPASAIDALIGDGHYLLPPLTGTEKTTGELFFAK